MTIVTAPVHRAAGPSTIEQMLADIWLSGREREVMWAPAEARDCSATSPAGRDAAGCHRIGGARLSLRSFRERDDARPRSSLSPRLGLFQLRA